MQKPLREFTLHLKRGPARPIRAYSYTVSSEDNKVYFHKRPDASDRTSFFVLSSVEGIDEVILAEAGEQEVSVDRARAYLDEVKQRVAEGLRATQHDKPPNTE